MNWNRKDIDQITQPWYCKDCTASNLPFCYIDDEGDFYAAIAERISSSTYIYIYIKI